MPPCSHGQREVLGVYGSRPKQKPWQLSLRAIASKTICARAGEAGHGDRLDDLGPRWGKRFHPPTPSSSVNASWHIAVPA